MDPTVDVGNLSIDPTPDTVQTPVTIDPSSPDSIQLSPDVAGKRASKAVYGLSGVSDKPADAIHTAINTGKEDQLRTEVASEIDSKKQLELQQRITDLANTKNGPLSIEDMRSLQASTDNPMDPNSVLEQQFGAKYMSNLYSANKLDPSQDKPHTWLDDAIQDQPEHVQATVDKGSTAVAKYQYLLKSEQDLQSVVGDEPWVSYIKDVAKMQVPFYRSAILRAAGSTGPSDFIEGGLLGSHLEAKRQQLFSLPFDQMKVEYEKTIDGLKHTNPQLALQFAHAMTGQSVDEQHLDNEFELLDISSLAAPSAALLRKVGLFNTTQTAVKTAVKSAVDFDGMKVVNIDGYTKFDSAGNPIKNPVTIFEPEAAIKPTAKAATGDLPEAAVSSSTETLVSKLNGTSDTTKEQVKALTTNYRLDKENVAGDPGRGGQELANRINERTDANIAKIEDTLTGNFRGNRTPALTESEDQIRAYKNELIDKFRGVDNSILDITGPHVNEAANTHHFEYHIGTNDGGYFESRNVARTNTKENGWALRPTVSIKINELNQEIGRLNKEGQTFKTAKGSTYSVKEDGTTIRNKALRNEPGHEGDQGLKPRSKKTVYLTEEQAGALAPPQGKWRIIDHEDGTLSTATPSLGGDYGISPSAKNISYSTEPEVGKTPLELFSEGKVKGRKSYSNIHFGNKITEVSFPKEKVASLRKQREALVKTHKGNLNKPLPGSQGATIEQQGTGFYIKLPTQQLNETHTLVRDGLITPQLNTTKEYRETLLKGKVSTSLPPNWATGYISSVVSRARTPEDTLSISENAMRKIAERGPSVLLQLAEDIAKPLKNVPSIYSENGQPIERYAQEGNKMIRKEHTSDFNRLIGLSQRMINPKTGLPGYFFKGPGEIDNIYQTNFGRFPTPAEIEGYFAWKDLIEYQRVLRSLNEYTTKARLGVSSFQVQLGKGVKTDFVDGKQLTVIPKSHGTIAVVGDEVGDERFWQTTQQGPGSMSIKRRNELQDKIDKGEVQLWEVYNPELRPFHKVSQIARNLNSMVRYVASDKITSRPIDWDPVARQEGGNLVSEHPFYIAYPRIDLETTGKTVIPRYMGDVKFAPVQHRVVGQAVADHMNTVRDLLVQGKEAEARAYSDTNLAFGANKHLSWYKPTRLSNGEIRPPLLDIRQNLHVISRREQIIDTNQSLAKTYPGLIDGTKGGSMFRKNQLDNFHERDLAELNEVKDIGTKGNPIYSHEPSELLDPIVAVNRSINKIINSTFIDDYKTAAMEHWLQQAMPWMKATENQIRSNPFRHFINAQNENVFKPNAPAKVVHFLMGNHQKIRQFTGIPSTVDNLIHATTQQLADDMYRVFGPKGDIIPVHQLPYATDPIAFVRSMAVHGTLGLFNIPQIVQQAMTITNIAAISPRHAHVATAAMMIHAWASVNDSPRVLDALDRMVGKVQIPGMASWKPGYFIEAHDRLLNSGFLNTIGAHQLTDNPAAYKTIKTPAGQFLDMGMLPFRLGNKVTATAAWYTAYSEVREQYPTGALTRQQWDAVFQRASLLDHNQSRASNSLVHTGVMSIPFMFTAYPLRIAEMMLSKRLTVAEKARWFGVSSLLFGIGVGGLGLFGFPAADHLRKIALDTGHYIPGQNTAETIAMDGVASLVIAAITGNGDPQKGTFYDTSRWSSKGIPTLSDILDEDRSFIKIVTGVPGSFLYKAWQNSNGFRMAVGSMTNPDNTQKAWPIKVQDLTDMLATIKTGDVAVKTYLTINAGKWMNSQGIQTVPGSASPAAALISAGVGLTPTSVSDTSLKQSVLKDRADAAKEMLPIFIRNFHLAMQADLNHDHEQAKDFFTRAYTALPLGGIPEDKYGQMADLARREFGQDRASKVDWNFYVKSLPDAAKILNLETTYKQQLQLQKNRE